MGIVFSTRFIGANVNGPGSSSYVVPDGFRAVIRDLSGRLSSSDTNTNNLVTAFVAIVDTFNVPIFFSQEFPAFTSGPTQWKGRAVADPGDTITVDCNAPGASWSVIVSGYLLTLP